MPIPDGRLSNASSPVYCTPVSVEVNSVIFCSSTLAEGGKIAYFPMNSAKTTQNQLKKPTIKFKSCFMLA
jgi:hypothetical protein